MRFTPLGLGCAPLGNLYRRVEEAEALAVVDAAWSAGIRYFDTAPLYGAGLSEERLGRALARRRRDEFVVSTKVGRLVRRRTASAPGIFDVAPDVTAVFDFSADGVRRSLEESLERLGLDRVDVAYVHDPDDHQEEALRGAFPALIELREHGVVGAVGAGMNQWQALDRFVREVDLDVVLVAGRYTLLDQSAAEVLLPRCAERGVSVVLGGVFNSGVLAADPGPGALPGTGAAAGVPMYDYAPASEAVLARTARLRAVCAARGTPLGAAALRYALGHPAVTSVLVGARSVAELTTDLSWATHPVPEALWTELGVPLPGGPGPR